MAADVDHWLKAAVQYTDPHGPNKAEFASTGQIGGSNVKPTFDEAAPVIRDVPENSAVGTEVGTAVTASDGDGDTLTYSLGGTDASFFTIDSSSGQIKAGTAGFDYESRTTYSVTVSVHDGKDAAGDDDTSSDAGITVTITITDVNEPPVSRPPAPRRPSLRTRRPAPRSRPSRRPTWTKIAS